MLENPELKKIVMSHNKTVAQVILRWHIQRDIIIIPKSSNPRRIKENFQLFDFQLTSEEMDRINQLNIGRRYSHSPTCYIYSQNRLKVYVKIGTENRIISKHITVN